MSSSPPPRPPRTAGTVSRLRRWLSGWTLRRRLVVALVALIAVLFLVIGLVTQAVLNRFLVHQLDSQLTDAAKRTQQFPPSPAHNGPGDEDDGDYQFPRGTPTGTLAAKIDGGVITSAEVLDGDGTSDVADSELPTLASLPVDGEPHTRALGALGTYRLRASRTPDGDVIITGLPMASVNDTMRQTALVGLLVAGSGLLVAGLTGAAIVRITLRPLRRIAATASRVSELPLDRGEVALSVRVPETDTDARTEAGQVGAALNRMLGHVAAALSARQASEMRVRQFVADASHELRTPLTAIRGYAELARRVQDRIPADIAHSVSRVESESGRMTILVDDMLLLARLDSGRPLAQEPVDLSRLLVDAVTDAHAAGPDHTWKIDLPDELVVVTGDGARLHQVVANLLANARTHTPPGTVVMVTLATEDGDVVLTVSDDGPGIPPNLLPDIFERFARGDTSRSRAAGSTGLGLAIVAAVIEAHHGIVTADSEPGRTTFTVRLPRQGRDPSPHAPRTGVDAG